MILFLGIPVNTINSIIINSTSLFSLLLLIHISLSSAASFFPPFSSPFLLCPLSPLPPLLFLFLPHSPCWFLLLSSSPQSPPLLSSFPTLPCSPLSPLLAGFSSPPLPLLSSFLLSPLPPFSFHRPEYRLSQRKVCVRDCFPQT